MLSKQEIGARLKERRTALGLSQDDLKKVTELSKAQVSRIERGESGTTWETLAKLSSALHMPTDWMGAPDGSAEALVLDRLEPKVLRRLMSMPRAKQLQLLHAWDNLVEASRPRQSAPELDADLADAA